MCTTNNAVIDESEQQEIISQKRSFDSNESSSSMKHNQPHRKYVSLSELNQSVEVVLNANADSATNKEGVVKSYNVVDLDDEVSTDNSGSNRSARDDGKTEDHAIPLTNDEGDIISVGPSKKELLVAWSLIAKQLEEDIAQGIVPLSGEVAAIVEDDERTQGSDNSKCSFGYEKPIIKEKSYKKSSKSKSKPTSPPPPQPPKDEHEGEEVLKSLYTTTDQPVLDKTPSKLGKTNIKIVNDEQFDNTTCTWSESADSAIPTVIYIRRDIPPVVPDDEALGQNYTPQQLRAIHDYTNRINNNNNSTSTSAAVSKSYLMKGLRFLTLGAIGSNNKEASMTPISTKMKKIHLDDDASEAFHQTLIDI